MQSDNKTFTAETKFCTITNATITFCTLPVSIVQSAPYLLTWGSTIVAKVYAINSIGNSTLSLQGGNAVLSTFPDPPTALVEDLSQRSKSTLGLSWT